MSFQSDYGRKPIAGVDYDPNGEMCQDDYEYLTGTGAYRKAAQHGVQPTADHAKSSVSTQDEH